MNKALIY